MTERMLADVQFLRAQDLLVRGDCMLPVELATTVGTYLST